MRSFLTHFPNSATRAALSISSLLVCLACATRFSVESLEEGMTAEAVRENFGEPEAIATEPGGVDSSWTYLHEELDPVPLTAGPMPLRAAVSSILFGIPFCWLFALADVVTDDLETGLNWNFAYVSRAPVVLEFEEEKLVRWGALGDIRETCGGSGCPPHQDQLPIPGSGRR